jgi:cyanophycinase-like exopeptidase
MMAHSLALVHNQVAELQTANQAAMQRKSHKKKRVQQEGMLTVKESVRLTILKEFAAHSNGRKAKKRVHTDESKLTQRRCSKCRETGYNQMTCKKDMGMISQLDLLLSEGGGFPST